MKIISNIVCFIIMLSGLFFTSADVFAIDNGTNKDGKVVVPETIAMRCGLSSENSQITQDCLLRLAYDFKTNSTPFKKFVGYNEEFNKIKDEYLSGYLAVASEHLLKVSGYDKRSEELAGKLAASTTTPTLGAGEENTEEILEKIRATGELSLDNFSMMLDALEARSMEMAVDSINIIFDVQVPRLASSEKVDSTNKTLGQLPTSGGIGNAQ